ncbi:hypothetical protein JQC91_14805 [Jannaschia sp. Os4]|uniref:hypothetical protein n=1 Tax=Jannaschia sp. Os4 TaxID=2807617 RepID=UPI001939EED6|nr:hypothetical protein [Jannaschia sp. Os4]MBM2577574.1 hypothetical protein [Jannaschia sp. Os4]
MSRARLLLHLGMDKTGSTSIQKAHGATLEGEVRWPAPALQLQRLLTRSYGGARDEPDARDEVRALLARAARNGGTVVVSHEAMSRWRAHRIAEALQEWMPLFDRVEAIAYLRAPLSYLASRTVERVKQWPLPDALAHERPRYRTRLAPWEEALGREAMTYALYDRAALAEGDVTADFAVRAGLPPAETAVRNPSPSREAVAVLAVYRAAVGREPRRHGHAPLRRPAVLALDGFGTGRFRLAPGVLDGAGDHAAQVAWAEARLDRPFPEDRAAEGFADADAILAYGAALGGALRDWAATRVAPGDLPPDNDVPGLVEALRRASEAPRRPRGRGWLPAFLRRP